MECAWTVLLKSDTGPSNTHSRQYGNRSIHAKATAAKNAIKPKWLSAKTSSIGVESQKRIKNAPDPQTCRFHKDSYSKSMRKRLEQRFPVAIADGQPHLRIGTARMRGYKPGGEGGGGEL